MSSPPGTDRGRNALLRAAHALPGPWGFLLVLAICGIAAGAALWLGRRIAPETAGSGIPHLKAVLHRLRGMRRRRVLLVKFASGTLGIGARLALGREGPTVQLGGALGQMVSGWLNSNTRARSSSWWSSKEPPSTGAACRLGPAARLPADHPPAR